MLFKLFPYNILFFFTLIASIFIILNTNNFLFLWVRLELNLLSFIPIILSTSRNYETEGAIKYFLIQAIASILFLIIIIISLSSKISPFFYSITYYIILITILIKLGAAPCHIWFPQVIVSLNWLGCLLLSTIQKLNPLLIIFFLFSSWKFFILLFISILNSFVGGFGGINQTQIRALIRYSSIRHISWILVISSYSLFFSLIYILIYIIISSIFILYLLTIKKFSLNQFNITLNFNFTNNFILLLNLLSLAGLPPFLGFLPKWIVINKIINYSPILLLILIFGSFLNLFYYLYIFFASFLSIIKSQLLNSYFNYSLMLIISISSLCLLIIIYAMIIFY